MGQGSVVGAGDSTLPWQPISADNMYMEHWKTACAKS
jgi:hypothetical protein